MRRPTDEADDAGRRLADEPGDGASRSLSAETNGPGLRAALEAIRAHTLWLLSDVDDDALRRGRLPLWSPLGWHLGHVAYTEARFLLRAAEPGEARWTALVEDRAAVFSQEHSVKAERGARLPPRGELEAYARRVREAVLARLGGLDPAYARFVLQHERQHAETVAVIRQVARIGGGAAEGARAVEAHPAVDPAHAAAHRTGAPGRAEAYPAAEPLRAGGGARRADAAEIPGGHYTVGGEGDPWAYDNELPGEQVRLAPFALARIPVTCGAFRAFIEDGGYADPAPWTEAGWAWRTAAKVHAPAAWEPDGELRTPFGTRPFHPDLPVYGISQHEAAAFARWAGARLPTEAEWEVAARLGAEAERKVAARPRTTGSELCVSRTFPWGEAAPGPARCVAAPWARGPEPVAGRPAGASLLGLHDLAGQVWEWTATPFAARAGFSPWPYAGYSSPYFDGRHRVLKGGSFATHGSILRGAFRNWYEPHVRSIFAGVRLAWDRGPARSGDPSEHGP